MKEKEDFKKGKRVTLFCKVILDCFGQSVPVFVPIQPTYYCLQEEKELHLFTQKKQEEGIILGSVETAASRTVCLFLPPAASHL